MVNETKEFYVLISVADLGGRPPTAQNFLNFMQFFAKFGKIICWRPPRRVGAPPTGDPGSAPESTIHNFKMSVCYKMAVMTTVG